MADKKGFKLEWDMPLAATEVYLYRVDGATPPKATVGKSGPVVAGGKLILKGKKNQYTDPDVRPGKTYTYVIFASYGGGQFSPKGVTLTLTVPVPPDPVDRLTVGFDQKKRRGHLEWHNPNPPNRWDSVIVRRREPDGKYTVVSQGKITQLDDSGVEAGRRYIYEVRVVQGEMQSPTRTVELVCKCPVTGFGGQYHSAKGVVKLNWQTPPAATAVHLYRAVGTKEPVVNEQGGKLVATGDPPLLTDRSNMYVDSDIRPGQTYTYLAIAVFGHGTFARSNAVSIRVPKLPDPPSHATAEFDTDSFVIRWKGLKDSNSRYRVYRKPGADAPVSPNDGKLVGDTNQELLRDSTNVEPGVWYAYSVFSVRGDQVSAIPASTPSAGALFALKNVKANVKGNVVHIDWKAPPSADCVLVAAADTAPPMRFRGTNHHRLPPGGDFSESTAYGSTRGYLIACGYKGLDGKLYISKAYRETVVVDHPLGTIEDFCAEPDHERGMITCRWSTQGVGQLRIYRLQADHGLVPGTEHDLAALGAFRQAQPEHVGPGEGEWRDTRPDASRPWYCSFLMSRNGNKVRIGPSHRVGIVPPLGLPSIKRKGDGVALMFDWPASVDLVEVNARFNDRSWPAPVQVRRNQYVQWGNEVRLFPKEGEGLYEYEITPCREEFRGLSRRVKRPWIGVPRQLYVSWQPRRDGIHFSWRLHGDPLPQGYQFGGIQLLANANGVPLSSREPDSVVLAQSPAGAVGYSTQGFVIPYAEIVRRLGDVDSAFFRAELVLPGHDHGNVLNVQCGCSAVSLNLKTRRFVGEDKQAAVQKYASRATDFICPHCWKKYPVGEMLYADSDQLPEDSPETEFFRMRGGVLGRLLNAQPPGKYKYCPGESKHLQGKFAGSVSNRLIGLLGPSESGKTYYVASVLQALHEFPDNAMDAYLASLGEYTRQKTPTLVGMYRSGKKLPKTPRGRADYLNYLLTVGERHWNPEPSRSLLFSVQDTGGENLESESEMRENLPYLDFCSGLILIVDPLQFPKIRDRLNGVVPLPGEHTDCRTQNIMSRLRTILDEKQQSEIPLALVITKCDVLLEHGLLSDVNLWGWENTTRRQKYSWDHHNDITGLFAAFMQEHEPGTYKDAIEQFPIHAFFGVSATGTSKMEKDVDGNDKFVRIEAKHVLDPIWWMLATMNMIKTSRMEW